MKIKIRRRATAVLKELRDIDPATGVSRRIESHDALKARIPLEEVVAQCLEQEPDNPGSDTVLFCCFMHADEHPSMWVDTEARRWGCRAGCYQSGDVYDFIRLLYDEDFKWAVDWVKKWDYNHNHSDNRGRS